MIDRLYLARGDRTCGPFSASQLRGLAAAGRIRLTDSVWREGAIERSVLAASVRNLFPPPHAPAHGEDGGVAEAAPPLAPPVDDCPTEGLVALDPSPALPDPLINPGEVDQSLAAVQGSSAPPVPAALVGAGDLAHAQ